MASYPIPPWLHPLGDPGELYLQAQAQHTASVQAQQRLAAERERAMQQEQVEREALAERSRDSQQRLMVEAARVQAYSGMRTRSLDIAEQRANAQAQAAARQFAAHQELSQRVAAGEDAAQVALTTPGLGLPGSGIAALAHQRSAKMAPAYVPDIRTDEQTGRRFGFNARTGGYSWETQPRAAAQDTLTQKDRARLINLRQLRTEADKALNSDVMAQYENMSDDAIAKLSKNRKAGAMATKKQAQALRTKVNDYERQINAILGEGGDEPATAPAAEAQEGAPQASIAERKLARAKELAAKGTMTQKQIMEQLTKEFGQ